jgi:hypothetical protein
MLHSLRKECSALLCEAVQARIEVNDPGFERDHCMKRVKTKRKLRNLSELIDGITRRGTRTEVIQNNQVFKTYWTT